MTKADFSIKILINGCAKTIRWTLSRATRETTTTRSIWRRKWLRDRLRTNAGVWMLMTAILPWGVIDWQRRTIPTWILCIKTFTIRHINFNTRTYHRPLSIQWISRGTSKTKRKFQFPHPIQQHKFICVQKKMRARRFCLWCQNVWIARYQ